MNYFSYSIELYRHIQSKRGTVIWYSAEYMATPEVLLDSLLDAYANFMEDRITDNERELTKQETDEIQKPARHPSDDRPVCRCSPAPSTVWAYAPGGSRAEDRDTINWTFRGKNRTIGLEHKEVHYGRINLYESRRLLHPRSDTI